MNKLENEDLRKLLNKLILSNTNSNQIKLIDMEAAITMGNTPMKIVNLSLGAFVLSKLKSKILYKMFLKWFLVVSVISTTGIISYQLIGKKSEPHNFTKIHTNPNQKKQSIANNVTVSNGIPKKTNTRFSINNGLFLTPFKLTTIETNSVNEIVPPSYDYNFNANEKTFSSIKTILVDANTSNIKIIGDSELKDVFLRTNLDDSLTNKELQKYIHIETSISGENMNIVVKNKNKKSIQIFSKASETPQAELELRIPKFVNVVINNEAGNVSIKNLQNEQVSINNSYGNVNLIDVVSKSTIKVNSGNITITNNVGELVLKSDYGNISVENSKGDVNAKIESGNFKGLNTEGDFAINNQYGNVTIEDAKGTSCNASIESGNFKIEKIKFSNSNFNVQYGNINIINAHTIMTIKSESGNIHLSETKGNLTILSKYGNQFLANHSGNLNLKANSGKFSGNEISGDIEIFGEYTNINLEKSIGNLQIVLNSGNFVGNQITIQNEANFTSKYGNISLNLTNNIDELNCELNASEGTAILNKNGINIKKTDEKLVYSKGNVKILAQTSSGNIKIQ